jgi:hypothetical protein
MDPSPDKLRALGRELRTLVDQPAADRVQLAAWYAAARRLQKWIAGDSALSDAVPHAVWHYLSDADIRLKSPSYHQEQTLQLMEIVHILERGEVPKTDGGKK